MKNRESVTDRQKGVTQQRDTSSRARTPLRGKSTSVTVSRCHAKRDVTTPERDSDSPSSPSGRDRHGHVVTPPKQQSWMHVAAMNMVHDHEAGIHVEPGKLDAARRLLGLPVAA